MPEARDELNIPALLQAQRELLIGPQPAAPAGAAGTPAADSPGEDAFVNVRHYAFLVYGRKWWVLLVTALVMGAAALYSYARPSKYQASAEVVLSETFGGEMLLGRRRVYYDAEMLSRLAELPEVSRRAAEGFRTEIDALLSDGTDLDSNERQALAEYRARLEASGGAPQGSVAIEKYGVRVTAFHQGSGSGRVLGMIARAKAKARAKGIIDSFTDLAGDKREAERIEMLIKSNKEELAKVDSQLAVYSKGEIQNLPIGVLGQMDQLLFRRKALAQAEMEKREIEQSVVEIEKLLESSTGAGVSPEFGARLLRLRAEYAQMRERYQEGHPKLKRAETEIRAMEEFLQTGQGGTGQGVNTASPASAELVRLRQSARLAAAKVDALKKDIDDAQQELDKFREGSSETQKAVDYQQLVRERRALDDIGAELRRRAAEAKLVSEATQDKPGGEQGPVWLKSVSEPVRIGSSMGQNLGFAALLGLVMGVLLSLLLEHLDDTVRNELTARRASGLPVIARLPRFQSDDAKRYISASSPRSDVAETFKFFHNHVRYAARNAPERCLQVTSPGPEEGKSYVATNLALSFASEGNRVCLLDTDLRRSKTHERADILRPAAQVGRGLCGYLEGQISYEEALVPSEVENLYLILAGDRATNPPRLFRSERMRELIERLQQEFDVVVIDAPPVLPVVDSAIISSMVRATLLVVRFGNTRQGDLAESAARLAHVNAPLVGVVINGVHGSGGGYYYYGGRYRYRYGRGYGYGYGNYGS